MSVAGIHYHLEKTQKLKEVLTGYWEFTLVSAHAWNWRKFCIIIALGITFIIIMNLLLNVIPL